MTVSGRCAQSGRLLDTRPGRETISCSGSGIALLLEDSLEIIFIAFIRQPLINIEGASDSVGGSIVATEDLFEEYFITCLPVLTFVINFEFGEVFSLDVFQEID